MTDPLAEADPNKDSEPSLKAGFDNYRSLGDPNIRIISIDLAPVAMVAPFCEAALARYSPTFTTFF
jgi:hypothetical protein